MGSSKRNNLALKIITSWFIWFCIMPFSFITKSSGFLFALLRTNHRTTEFSNEYFEIERKQKWWRLMRANTSLLSQAEAWNDVVVYKSFIQQFRNLHLWSTRSENNPNVLLLKYSTTLSSNNDKTDITMT